VPTGRARTADALLTALDDLVRRHRALRPAPGGDDVPAGRGDGSGLGDLHAELITAEVAQELAKARAALRRHPLPRPVPGRPRPPSSSSR
jgi:hypothetical protein